MVNYRLNSQILQVVEDQIRQNDPKCTRETYHRLKKLGYSEHQAKEMIGAVLIHEIYDIMNSQAPFNEERYSKTLSSLPDYIGEEGDEDDMLQDDIIQMPIINENKIGRNEPCSCGSGKKYKKCCGNGNIVVFPTTNSVENSKENTVESGNKDLGNFVYQLKIIIRDIEPPIWRRIQVPQNITFYKLHKIIQAAFGWQDYHLFDYDFDDLVIHVPDTEFAPGELSGGRKELNAKRTKIDVLLRERKQCVYTYDFGDNWEHEILLEDIVPAENGQKYPVCLGGERSRPPEDVGGTVGYSDFLEIISNPKHPEYNHYLSWAEKDTGGRKFDPEYFYQNEVNRALVKVK